MWRSHGWAWFGHWRTPSPWGLDGTETRKSDSGRQSTSEFSPSGFYGVEGMITCEEKRSKMWSWKRVKLWGRCQAKKRLPSSTEGPADCTHLQRNWPSLRITPAVLPGANMRWGSIQLDRATIRITCTGLEEQGLVGCTQESWLDRGIKARRGLISKERNGREGAWKKYIGSKSKLNQRQRVDVLGGSDQRLGYTAEISKVEQF